MGNVFIPRGIEVPCLDQEKEWHFKPNRNLKKGDPVTGGDVIGNENYMKTRFSQTIVLWLILKQEVK